MYLNRKLWSLTAGLRGRIWLSVGMGLGGSVLGMLRLLLIGWVIAQVLSGADLKQVGLVATAALVLMLVYAYWDYRRLMMAHDTASRVQRGIRQQLFDRMVDLGPAHFAHLRSGELSSAAVEGIEQLEIYFGRYLPQFFVAVVTPLVIFAVVAWLDLPVAAVLLAAALFTLLAPALFHRWDTENSMRRARAYRAFAAEFLDSLQGLVTLKAFGQSKARESRLAEHAAELFRSTMWVLATNSLTRGITDLGIALGAAAALALSAYRVSQGLMEFETLIMVLLLGVEVFRPLRELRGLLHDGMLADSAAQQVFSVLDAKPRVDDSGTRSAKDIAPELTFDAVSFAYHDGSVDGSHRGSVHDGLTFKVKAGERIGVVGGSGSGKSTITRLLLRYYDPDAGVIRIGDADIRTLPLDALRSQFAVVNQDTYLFHGTVRENLLLGNPDASEEHMRAAARSANAEEFIEALPGGYDTVIGERGLRLSGGQKQRLAIARALLRDAPILILDEALSSVDARNESVIQSALDRLMVGRTTLIMAHRLSSIIGCDRIMVLDQGRVAEQGSHAELIGRGGVYARLMASQITDRRESDPGDEVVTLDTAGADAGAVRVDSGRPASNVTVVASDSEVLVSDKYSWGRVLTQLLRFAAPWKGRCVATFVFGVLRVLAFIGVGLLSALATVAVKNGSEYGPLLITLGAVAVLAAVFHWLESWLAHDMAFRMLSQMRIELFRKLDSLAPAFMLRRRSGDMIHLATHDIEMVEYFFAHTITPVFVAVLVPTLVLSLLAAFDPLLALGLLPFLLLVVLMPVFLRSRIDRLAGTAREVLGELSAHTVESLQGLGELLACQAGSQRRKQFVELIDRHQRERIPFFREMSRHIVLTDLFTVMAGLAVTLIAVWLVSKGRIDPVYLPLLALASMAAFLPVIEISDAGRQLAETFAATNRLIQVHDSEPTVQDQAAGATKILPRGKPLDVVFKGVTFSYELAERPALQQVDLRMAAGTTVAIVGASGAGKSTLAHLLLRFWDPDQGTIEISGIDIRRLCLDHLRTRIALVAQDTWLFNDSLRANLLMARPEAGETELMQAISRAELGDFVKRLPEGLGTRVGERGYALSGGQRQRVSIARAFLRDAPILVLDEATSHLDALSEQAVHRALNELMQDRTTLVIAHRLATVRDADQIVVMGEGRILEQGNHEELLRRQSAYAGLLKYQVGSGQQVVAA